MQAEPLRETSRMLVRTIERAVRANRETVTLELPTVAAIADQLARAADALDGTGP